ncbi:MAG: 3-deoxy-7-phosphoheptulonate synthase, partial [Lachnospiraceae bacterium]|nr:3-deoxy-7-phosphoheptulonate synthase [Lachnospiraceae bacterium]
MIIIMKPNAQKASVEAVIQAITSRGLQAHLSEGDQVTIVGVVGDKTRLMHDNLELIPGVDKILSVTETYKLANKKFHPHDSRILVGDTPIGPGSLTLMAGPCAIENEEMMMQTALAVKASGATFLRGGAYKPRTSPYAFQGLEEEGLRYIRRAGDAVGLKVICEVTSLKALETAVKYVDMLQIGARNMQ